jgi:outer membrane protein assembly factor BamB
MRPFHLRWLAALAPALILPAQDGAGVEFWPQWRGPLQNGMSPTADPPTRWSETENVRWKTELPGLGHSTPIVWDDRVFVTTAIPFGEEGPPVPDDAPGAHDNAPVTRQHEFAAIALDRATGEILWQRVLRRQLPHAGGHVTGSLASGSPVTDGTHLFAFFGSRGIYCLDFDGELVWEVDLGDLQILHGHGEGSSPALWGDTLVVTWDHESQSFVTALDKRTGKEIWRRDRDEVTSWATPIVLEHAGKPQVVVSGTHRVRGYDLATGEVLWECGGLSHNIVASPVAAEGLVFAGSSYEKKALLAIRLDGASGDVTGTEQIAWRLTRRTPYVPSPLWYHGRLYILAHYQGLLSRVDAKTGVDAGEPLRLHGLFDIYASPVAAAGRVYVVDRSGTTVVVDDKKGAALAQNRLDDVFNASPALAGRDLFLRGERRLYCLRE